MNEPAKQPRLATYPSLLDGRRQKLVRALQKLVPLEDDARTTEVEPDRLASIALLLPRGRVRGPSSIRSAREPQQPVLIALSPSIRRSSPHSEHSAWRLSRSRSSLAHSPPLVVRPSAFPCRGRRRPRPAAAHRLARAAAVRPAPSPAVFRRARNDTRLVQSTSSGRQTGGRRRVPMPTLVRRRDRRRPVGREPRADGTLRPSVSPSSFLVARRLPRLFPQSTGLWSG